MDANLPDVQLVDDIEDTPEFCEQAHEFPHGTVYYCVRAIGHHGRCAVVANSKTLAEDARGSWQGRSEHPTAVG